MDKKKLSMTSGLTVRQVEAWFSRVRRRKLLPVEMVTVEHEYPGCQSQLLDGNMSHKGPYHMDLNPESVDVISRGAVCKALTLDSTCGMELPVGQYSHPFDSKFQTPVNTVKHHSRARSCPPNFRIDRHDSHRSFSAHGPNHVLEEATSPGAGRSSLEALPTTRQGTSLGDGSLPFEPNPSDLFQVIGTQPCTGKPLKYRSWGLDDYLESLPVDGTYEDWEEQNKSSANETCVTGDTAYEDPFPADRYSESLPQTLAVNLEEDNEDEVNVSPCQPFNCTVFPPYPFKFSKMRQLETHIR